MDALLNPQTGGYVVNQSAQSIENELYIRLVTPLGSYWADRTLGSRLHELRRQKHLKRIEVLAKQYAEQALQPVLQSKRAQSIQVTTSTPQRGWLKLHIEAVDAAGDTVTISHKVAVI
jgi:phage protein GP46